MVTYLRRAGSLAMLFHLFHLEEQTRVGLDFSFEHSVYGGTFSHCSDFAFDSIYILGYLVKRHCHDNNAAK
jgi:hypothetical protein